MPVNSAEEKSVNAIKSLFIGEFKPDGRLRLVKKKLFYTIWPFRTIREKEKLRNFRGLELSDESHSKVFLGASSFQKLKGGLDNGYIPFLFNRLHEAMLGGVQELRLMIYVCRYRLACSLSGQEAANRRR